MTRVYYELLGVSVMSPHGEVRTVQLENHVSLHNLTVLLPQLISQSSNILFMTLVILVHLVL